MNKKSGVEKYWNPYHCDKYDILRHSNCGFIFQQIESYNALYPIIMRRWIFKGTSLCV